MRAITSHHIAINGFGLGAASTWTGTDACGQGSACACVCLLVAIANECRIKPVVVQRAHRVVGQVLPGWVPISAEIIFPEFGERIRALLPTSPL
jgi:hypothetical protein